MEVRQLLEPLPLTIREREPGILECRGVNPAFLGDLIARVCWGRPNVGAQSLQRGVRVQHQNNCGPCLGP